MTEFGSLQEIQNALRDAKFALTQLRKEQAVVKRKYANSTELRKKEGILRGLHHLVDANKKSLSDVSTDDKKQKLVELYREIEAVEEEIDSIYRTLDDFVKQENVFANRVAQLEEEEKRFIVKSNLSAKFSKAASLFHALVMAAEAFNPVFNPYGVLNKGEVITENAFVMDMVKSILSDKFDERQTAALMAIARSKTEFFIEAYTAPDDDYNISVGTFFTILHAEIEAIEAFTVLAD